MRDSPSGSSTSEGEERETDGCNKGEGSKEKEEYFGLSGDQVRDGPSDSFCSEEKEKGLLEGIDKEDMSKKMIEDQSNK